MTNHDIVLSRSSVHDQWQDLLSDALEAVDADYLSQLLNANAWLPGIDNLFSAFRRDRLGVRYVLIGESPYPRKQSANGIAFYDAAVNELWSETGLSKSVNRATSLRNIIKTALLAEGYIRPDSQGKISQASIAAIDKTAMVQTLGELFQALENNGFLMLNATPVLHPERKPSIEAKYWQGFLLRLLEGLGASLNHSVTLVLWGKIAESIEALPIAGNYQKLVCEHPYNLSFIQNPIMQSLFGELKLLSRQNNP
jgi:uracil-DNA glycosylase